MKNDLITNLIIGSQFLDCMKRVKKMMLKEFYQF